MPSTSSDDDDDIPEARVISEEPEEDKPKYDPRDDFMKGFGEGRPETPYVTETVPKLRALAERINELERMVDELRRRVERLENRG